MEEVGGGQAGPFEDLEVVRMEAGMLTVRFVRLIDLPERTWCRWQVKARWDQVLKGPWPQPAWMAARDVVVGHALAKLAWGHRKIWALIRHDGHQVSQASVLRLLRDEGLLLASGYQKQRRELAKNRRAVFTKIPHGPNQVWHLDFSECETTTGGTWRIAGCRDWSSTYEHPWHVSPTGNKHDAIAAVEAALDDYQALFGHPLADACPINPTTGEVLPAVTIVTDNGGPFHSINFELFITSHPELRHVRTRVNSPGAERLTRTRVRHAEVRALVPRRDP